MASAERTTPERQRWYFTSDLLRRTPSILSSMDPEKELSYRQQAASLIQDIGQKLNVKHLVINTAIVYMHRFYMFHTFAKYQRNDIATCALFLAAKVEEDPRKLEHVIRVSYACLHRENPHLDVQNEAYRKAAENLVVNELLMLQTLGFEVSVDHPHSHVVKGTQLMNLSKELAQTAYFMATNSLHLTTMCLEHKPTTVACVCIHLACKWAKIEVPKSADGKNWWYYIDKSVTKEKLDALTEEFLRIFEKSPSKLRRKLASTMGKRLDKGDKPSGSGSSGGMAVVVDANGRNAGAESHTSHHSHKTSSHSSGTKSLPVSRQATPQHTPKSSKAEAQPVASSQMPALPKLEPLVHTPHKQRELGSIPRSSSSSSSHHDTGENEEKTATNGQCSKPQSGNSSASAGHTTGSSDAPHRQRSQSSSKGGMPSHHASHSHHQRSGEHHQRSGEHHQRSGEHHQRSGEHHKRSGEHHRSHSQSHRHQSKHSRDQPENTLEKSKERPHAPHKAPSHHKSQSVRPSHPHGDDARPTKKRRVEELEPGEIPDDDTEMVPHRAPPIPPLPPLPSDPPPDLPPPPPGQ